MLSPQSTTTSSKIVISNENLIRLRGIYREVYHENLMCKQHMLIMCYLILMFTVAVTKSAMHFGGTLENTGTGYTGTDIQVYGYSGVRVFAYTDIKFRFLVN